MMCFTGFKRNNIVSESESSDEEQEAEAGKLDKI